jgi:hypothetical protein
MKEIIGDDYPTYEDSVKLTLAEREVHKDNLERLMQENFELRHRLACIADDIVIISNHIEENCNKKFKRPSLNPDGSVYADQAWHNISNIEIACDLNSDDSLEWTSDVNRV